MARGRGVAGERGRGRGGGVVGEWEPGPAVPKFRAGPGFPLSPGREAPSPRHGAAGDLRGAAAEEGERVNDFFLLSRAAASERWTVRVPWWFLTSGESG